MQKETWNNFLKNHSHSVFQTSEWIDVLTDDSWKPVYLVNDDWSGGIVLMFDGEKYESLYLGCYGGYIGKPVNICELMSTSLHYIRIVDYQNTFKEHWDKKMVSTYLLDIRDYKMSHGRKDDLRKSNLAGVKIIETKDIPLFNKLYLEAIKQFPNTRDIKPIEYFERILKSGLAKFYISYIEDAPVAISLHLFYNGEIFNYITMGISKGLGFLTSITKYVIDTNSEYNSYNFGVSVSDGNEYYKKSWGAREYKYPIYGIIFQTKYEYE